MKKGAKFDGNDRCFKDLADTTTGPYVTALNTRASNNGKASFEEYLLSTERDTDLYPPFGSDNDPYDTPLRGKDFASRIEQYRYDAFNGDFRQNLNTQLFYMDVNDYAIDECGIDGKLVTSYNIPPLDARDNDSLTLTIQIDDSFVGTINLRSLLESDNRLYIHDAPYSNLNIVVKAKPVDTDGDGVYDPEDNCRLVPNTGQADINHIS